MATAVTTRQDEMNALVERLVQEAPKLYYWNFYLPGSATWQHILKLSGEEQRYLVFHLITQFDTDYETNDRRKAIVRKALIDLLRQKIPFTHDELVGLINWLHSNSSMDYFTLRYLINNLKDFKKTAPITPELSAGIRELVRWLRTAFNSSETHREIRRLEQMISDELELPIVAGESWADQAISDICSLPESARRQWIEFIAHMQASTSSAPSGKWQKRAKIQLEQIGYGQFRQFVLGWFPLVDKARTVALPQGRWGPDPNELINYINADILRGLAWVCAEREDGEVARALTTLALSAYRKVPQVGPRGVRVGNGCIWALGNMPGMVGVYQLARLQAKVKFGPAQKGVEKALTTAAEREGLPRDDIEELAMPTYGLTSVGVRQEQFGDFSAELQVIGTHNVELKWFKPDGKEQKAVPKQVKADFAEELKELQGAAKEIQTMLPAQRDRIDNLYLQRKSWAYATWRERYLDHPLIGVLARRLIWRFNDGNSTIDAIWHHEGMVNSSGQMVETFGPETRVTLWHPIDAAIEEIVAWRNWLEQQEIQQPFKQSHREIYILTEAERRTESYSNRFAAHVLRQHQFNSLCAVRGWRNQLRLMVDASYPPAMKELPAWGLRAEYWIEGAGDTYHVDTNDTGTYLRVVTDQVRFYPIDAPNNYAYAGGGGYGDEMYGRGDPHEALPLEQVPPLVFSEIMRDVDLFVGVASVGNDPTWSDGGPNGRYRDYWTHYSFGELSETAQTRKAVLENLVPRLKIASRCELRDRFLVVRGKKRTYKIHLGSSNILMEPNDQYLCIVPGQGQSGGYGEGLFLPFEGDRTLATILSKAFLLADDSSITDPTILRQIER